MNDDDKFIKYGAIYVGIVMAVLLLLVAIVDTGANIYLKVQAANGIPTAIETLKGLTK